MVQSDGLDGQRNGIQVQSNGLRTLFDLLLVRCDHLQSSSSSPKVHFNGIQIVCTIVQAKAKFGFNFSIT